MNLRNISWSQGDFVSSHTSFLEGLETIRELEDLFQVAAVLQNLGTVAWATGDLDGARLTQEESLQIARENGFELAAAASLNGLGILAFDRGDYESVRELQEVSLRIRRKLRNVKGIASTPRTRPTTRVLEKIDYLLAR